MTHSLDYAIPKRKPPKPAPTARHMRIFLLENFAACALLIAFAFTDLWVHRFNPAAGWSTLGSDLAFGSAALAVPVCTVALWLSRLTVYKESWARRRRAMIPFLTAVAIVVSTILLIEFEIPFRLAFAYSRASLEGAVADMRAKPVTIQLPRTLGVLPVQYIQIEPTEAKVIIQGAGFDLAQHLALSSTPVFPTARQVQSLGHDWYLVIGY